MSDSEQSELPYLTATPGCGGFLRQSPDDFRVEELPLYEPCGEGEFLYATIEKRNLSTPDLISHIARRLGISTDEIGTAGLKDRVAITRQTVAIPARAIPDPAQIELASDPDSDDPSYVRILGVGRHTNKLRTGHLRGNRFEIVLRDLADHGLEAARQTQSRIEQTGIPNYFGEQRFGYSNSTDEPGFRLLRGERTKRLSKSQLRLALSAAQSRLFNHWLRDRVLNGLLHTVLDGDVMQVCASGGCFVADDPVSEQARFDQRETTLTGPIFGPKMRTPERAASEREAGLLTPFNVCLDDFSRFKNLTSGTRRPALLFPENLQLEPVDHGLRFRFTLPAGAYATVLLREFQKAV